MPFSRNVEALTSKDALKLKKNMVSFYGWGATSLRLEPLRGGSLFFTTKLPEIPNVFLKETLTSAISKFMSSQNIFLYSDPCFPTVCL